MKKIIFAITILLAGLGIFSVASKALAADVDTTLTPPGAIVENNIAPGQVFTKKITVTNNTGDHQDLRMKFINRVSTGSPDLAGMIIVTLKKLPGGPFLSFPNGNTSELLSQFGEHSWHFDTLADVQGVVQEYELAFTFDPTAGNEYQSKKVVFDLSVGIEVDTTTNVNNGGGGPAGTGAGLAAPGFAGLTRTTGIAPGAVSGVETATGEVVAGEETPVVEGAETVCSEWPLWVWILLLFIYTAVFNYSSFRQGLENKIHWFFPALGTAVIFALWYFFDKCRYYTWYPYAIVIIALLSYFSYLSWFRKKKLEPDFKDEEVIK